MNRIIDIESINRLFWEQSLQRVFAVPKVNHPLIIIDYVHQ
jgi:hypothetical protein